MSDLSKLVEETEDCFILDFDPFDTFDLSKLKLSTSKHTDNELTIIAEKGQVACRDYPHPRHLCLNNPFEKTPHKSHCNLCYCFVCDEVAPCKDWDVPSKMHCDANDDYVWRMKRAQKKPIETLE